MKHTPETKKLLSKLKTTHGCSLPSAGLGYRTWLSWHMMFQRCHNPNHKSYKDYGGRGIYICASWYSFSNFLSDMGVKPSGTTLGRLNNSGPYTPLNCRWETPKQQARNRRSNRVISFNGESKTLQEWAHEIGITKDAIWHRLRDGWNIKDALTTPARYCHNSRSSFHAEQSTTDSAKAMRRWRGQPERIAA